jgi:hypothetical protein
MHKRRGSFERLVGVLPILISCACSILGVSPAAAQLVEFDEPAPQPQCPNAYRCLREDWNESFLGPAPDVYWEDNRFVRDGLRLQGTRGCGANCTDRYWVTRIDTDEVMLAISGRGVYAAVGSSGGGNQYRLMVRTIMADIRAGCCPTVYRDVTYVWNRDGNTLIESSVRNISPNNLGDALRSLDEDGFRDPLRFFMR